MYKNRTYNHNSPYSLLRAINPRIPGGSQQPQYSSGSQRRVSVVRPDTPSVNGGPIPLNPGYNSGFLKRIGEAEAEVQGLGGRPR